MGKKREATVTWRVGGYGQGASGNIAQLAPE